MSASPSREVAIFSSALELDASQRAAYLDKACADDGALREHLENLLRVHEQAIPFLESRGSAGGAQELTVRADGLSAAAPCSAPAEKAGDRIGRYKLLQQIGEGGCGVVYMADQEEPVRRRVALKVIKLGMDTRNVIARFEAERQTLALMDHPHIAKVLDAGATETGRPFFVMELVRGLKITDYCDEKKLPPTQRLALFIQVCQAIQHAHQKGIIHRDIKPSNILVTLNDGVAVPKVIDFGIAKATGGQQLTNKTIFTAFEQFIGTPAYMSPEQAVLTSLDIDTRSDIYALGVLLYELLTGQTPFDAKELLASGLDEMRRTIREQEPARPSNRLGTLPDNQLSTAAQRRSLEPPKLVSELRGDLDWIVMKCLEKDRARRYETANGLAMDVQRYLANESVIARPPSKLYRFQKLARRNKLAFGAGAAVFVALVAGLAVSIWFFLGEKAARKRTVAAEQQARAINRFLTEDLLFQATPDQNAREKKVTMEEVLDVATRNLDQNPEIARQPEVEATLRLAVGSTYLKLSSPIEAERNLRLAFTLRRSALGPEHLDTLAAEHKLAEFLVIGSGRYAEAEPLILETWKGEQRLLGAEHRDTLDSMEGYQVVLSETGRLREAEQIARQVLQISERALGLDAKQTIDALRNLSGSVSLLGKHAEAERLAQEALSRYQRTKTNQLGLFMSIKDVAVQRMLQGDLDEAEKLLSDAANRMSRVFGPDHFQTLWIQRVLALVLADQSRFAEAEVLAKATLAARPRQPGNQYTIGRTLLILGRVLVEQGKVDEAEPLLQEALTIFREHHIFRYIALTAQAENWLGTIQLARKAYPEAEALLLSGANQFFLPSGEMSPIERRVSVSHIIKLYEVWGKPEQAAAWQKKLDEQAQTRRESR